jgi:hypothetical protein
MAQLIWPYPASRQSLGNEFDAFGDGLLIPLRAVLLGQRHKAPVRPGTRRTPRIGKQHEGQADPQFQDPPTSGAGVGELAGSPLRSGQRAATRCPR